MLDRVVTFALLIAAVVPSILVSSAGLFVFLALPLPFFWWLGRRSGIAFALLAFPYYMLLYIACDFTNDKSTPFIHAYHEYFWVPVAYVVVRTVELWVRHSNREVEALDREEDLNNPR